MQIYCCINHGSRETVCVHLFISFIKGKPGTCKCATAPPVLLHSTRSSSTCPLFFLFLVRNCSLVLFEFLKIPKILTAPSHLSFKRVRARGGGAWACLAHGMQCLCDGRACCPARALQRSLCVLEVFTGTVTLLFQLVVSLGWYGLV